MTIDAGSTQGTFIFTNLQWDGPYFEGDVTNSLSGEKGNVEGSEFFGGINATDTEKRLNRLRLK
jgi:hypothetical protein